ncbi:MAG: DUF2007 domain-containing protein [Bacteroidales bacterium]|nr:DUF2007 domain-containing protein [Bacteroidales bacterium]
MKNLVVAETFFSASKAHIAQGRLQEEGIESMISDETVTQVIGITAGLGGIRLLVNEDDLDQAQKLIAEMDL